MKHGTYIEFSKILEKKKEYSEHKTVSRWIQKDFNSKGILIGFRNLRECTTTNKIVIDNKIRAALVSYNSYRNSVYVPMDSIKFLEFSYEEIHKLYLEYASKIANKNKTILKLQEELNGYAYDLEERDIEIRELERRIAELTYHENSYYEEY